ncbi:class I SAM-dependent DNA methyltransferase [Candidatus Palauibacter sp.]|uniref:class I SAM-dependent DNA methyltransferase n=1 Tax=Candidatus Palauibacter sp. TaxID=3101350 RepID=UPI003B01DF25
MSEPRASHFDDRIAPRFDDIYEHLPDADTAAHTLAQLAGKGRALELGIGTGRIALRLAALGIEVHGVDLSDAMVAELRRKPGGPDIPVAMDDFAGFLLDTRYEVVYVVYNTFFDLTSQDAQVRCFASVARHLNPGGVFVIEAFVPDHARLARGSNVFGDIYGDVVRVDVSESNACEQRLDARHVMISEAGIEVFSVRIRYAWPAELDLMARLAGLRLKERWADWAGNSFTSQSTAHVSVYVKPGVAALRESQGPSPDRGGLK